MMYPDARTVMAAAMSERELEDAVEALARTCGWLVYHTHDSRRSEAGFPDIVMLREGRLIFAELKSQKGLLGREQRRWLSALIATERVEVYVWRPEDWYAGWVEKVLR